MRLLFEIDTKDYSPTGKAYIRPSARAIIVRDGKIAMVHSRVYDYYKFPGGGIEAGESHCDALIRETAEEVGLLIDPLSIREYGYVHRVQKSYRAGFDFFIQDNFYYICNVTEGAAAQNLQGYEYDEGFELKFVEATHAIEINLHKDHGPKDKNMILRESKVLQLLIDDGIAK